MKLTWFGNSTFRIHIGGQIAVIDADAAPSNVDRTELTGGADHVVDLAGPFPLAEPGQWRPRPAERLLDSGEGPRPIQIWSMGQGNLVIDADEDRPLLVLGASVPAVGRWAEKSVVVLAGGNLPDRAAALIDIVSPRLVGLAGDDEEVGRVFAELGDRLDGTGLVAFEPGMAVEA